MNFCRSLGLSLALVLTAGTSLAFGQTIGVVVPRSGTFSALGEQILNGANFQAEASESTIVTIDDPCSADGGGTVAEQLIGAKVDAAIGFLCSETLEGALPALSAAGIPAITTSVRSQILMEDALKHGWLLYRLAPSDRAEAAKLVDVILGDWAEKPVALIDDGTLHGRELVDTIRNALEEKGLKPVFVDTYRPGQEQQVALVRRLARAGATHVFVGGDRSDITVIARDAAAEKIALTVLGGDALNAANRPLPLNYGVYAVTVPDYQTLPDALEVAKAMRAKGLEPEGYVLPAYAAATIAAEAVGIARSENKPIGEVLLSRAFNTVIGPVRFNEKHELADNPYRLLLWRGDAFAPPPTSAD
ncbi:branched-chain amino acid ABC transporter substrate-binding protein [Rhizobiaceae bacterium n13]|uniref:Branched-chain amino acid ABC transporter substrate-binding protein n=1 Tax=Ferirhizobium litorale TaxID=2927786 RepID=A0AAE3U4F4_9HYPH|nr:branched-chain amino acid ABC transporter substrate-binding protein [Fererhizobium litorale]MDI7863302.1 branched-chain amino acid ABC transporter substrate-binding protein [Fererhizobium litorale]MDI7922964.1 branched-chain amino acid ABC transporter substrate-binding protein [Fererhizobium litorale]